MIGFSFSIVTSWAALGGVLIVGIGTGGPPVMIWSWIGICIVTLAVAYSMAEMCSAYPVAGGQYSWVAILAPRQWARGLSYICGWFMLTGMLAMGAVNNFVTANFVLGISTFQHPGYTIKRWHTVLAAYLVCLMATCLNIWLPHLLDRISRGVLLLNIFSFVTIVVTILACNNHKQPASFVFKDFQNFTGFNNSYAAILGILQSAFGMCCYDAPAHMTEEMKNARKDAPKAIVLAVYIGAITGFIFLVTLCFCIGDIETTATTPTGLPILQIFYDSTHSIHGASALAALFPLLGVFCAFSLMAEGSRVIFAFARDNGLPFSSLLNKVEPKKKVPVYAILVAATVQLALNSIYFGTLTGFNTIISISTAGFYLSYAMPLIARILSRLVGQHTRLEGPYSLGRYSLPLNIVGFLFLAFACISFNFPALKPVNRETMNYTCAAISVVMFISLVTWLTTGRAQFAGPQAGRLIHLRNDARPDYAPEESA